MENYDIDMINEFVRKYYNRIQRNKMIEKLELAEVISIGYSASKSRESYNNYLVWNRNIKSKIEELNEEYNISEVDVFTKLRRQPRKPISVFDRLRQLKRNK